MKYKLLLLLILFLFTSTAFTQNRQERIDSIKVLINQKKGVDKAEQLLALAIANRKISADSSLAALKRMGVLGFPWQNDSLNFYYKLELSIAHKIKKEFELAHNHIEDAKPFINNIDSRFADYHENKGFIYYEQADFSKAKDEQEKALEFLDPNEDARRIVGIYNNISSSAQQLGQFKEAITLYQKALKFTQDNGIRDAESRAYNNLSILHKKMENYEKAEEFIKKSLVIDEELKEPRSLSVAYLNLGLIQRARAERDSLPRVYADVRKNYAKALKLAEDNDYLYVKGAVLANMANLENTLKNYSRAIEIGIKAQDFNIETKNLYGEMISTLNLGESYRGDRQFANSETQIDKALVLANKMNFQEGIEAVYNTQTLLYEDSGQFEKAFRTHKKYTKLRDSLKSVEVKNNLNELEVKFETEKKERDLAVTRANLAESELKSKQKNTLIYGALGLSLILGILGYLVYNQQKLKNQQLTKEAELSTALAKIETQNRLQEQRLRISRDLHDNIGSQLTFIISSIDNLKYGLDGAAEKTKNKLASISSFTSETIYELRDTIWAMNKENISFDDLQGRISNFINNAKIASEKTNFTFTVAPSVSKSMHFSSVQGMNLYRIIQEAVNNALKYADASVIKVSIDKTLTVETGRLNLSLKIEDNGKGFDLDTVEKGNGFNTIHRRAKDLGGNATISSNKGTGTEVSVVI